MPTDTEHDMITLRAYLARESEPLPQWLSQFDRDTAFDRRDFFQCRVVYYPGSGFDGHPVATFGSTYSAHCFLYVDYGIPKSDLLEQLDSAERRFRGYHSLLRRELQESDLAPSGWQPHITPADFHAHRNVMDPRGWGGVPPYAFLEILERDEGLTDVHGPERLAIIFLYADGIATYDALFCQRDSGPPPYALLLQDYGFGGNYSRFGARHLMERIAINSGRWPQRLLVAKNTDAWQGYRLVADVEGEVASGNYRCLWERDISQE
ncbi:MAG: hypothetical protein JJU22_05440 [Gammaproteobacteria bacterium]|nr:hypothetical protein [Gammaproteobacteria bacterium]